MSIYALRNALECRMNSKLDYVITLFSLFLDASSSQHQSIFRSNGKMITFTAFYIVLFCCCCWLVLFVHLFVCSFILNGILISRRAILLRILKNVLSAINALHSFKYVNEGEIIKLLLNVEYNLPKHDSIQQRRRRQ